MGHRRRDPHTSRAHEEAPTISRSHHDFHEGADSRGHVFAGKSTGKHVSSQALAKHLHGTSLKGRLVAHGLRSIARSWLADESVPFDVAEMCLSHDVGTQVSRAYQRSDFFDARRAVMERWSEHVRACAESAGMIDWK